MRKSNKNIKPQGRLTRNQNKHGNTEVSGDGMQDGPLGPRPQDEESG